MELTIVPAEAGASLDAAETAGGAAGAAVEIAKIQAERDVTMAEIHAETAVALSENEEDVAWLRGELDGLRAASETQEAETSTLALRLTGLETTLAALAGQVGEITTTILSTLPLPSEQAPPMPEEPPLMPEEPVNVVGDGLKEKPAHQERAAPAAPPLRRRWL